MKSAFYMENIMRVVTLCVKKRKDYICSKLSKTADMPILYNVKFFSSFYQSLYVGDFDLRTDRNAEQMAYYRSMLDLNNKELPKKPFQKIIILTFLRYLF